MVKYLISKKFFMGILSLLIIAYLCYDKSISGSEFVVALGMIVPGYFGINVAQKIFVKESIDESIPSGPSPDKEV